MIRFLDLNRLQQEVLLSGPGLRGLLPGFPPDGGGLPPFTVAYQLKCLNLPDGFVDISIERNTAGA